MSSDSDVSSSPSSPEQPRRNQQSEQKEQSLIVQDQEDKSHQEQSTHDSDDDSQNKQSSSSTTGGDQASSSSSSNNINDDDVSPVDAKQPAQGTNPDVEMDALSLHLLADQAEDKEKDSEELARLLMDGDDSKQPIHGSGNTGFDSQGFADYSETEKLQAKEAGIKLPDKYNALALEKAAKLDQQAEYHEKQQEQQSFGNAFSTPLSLPSFTVTTTSFSPGVEHPGLALKKAKYEYKLAKKQRELQFKQVKKQHKYGNNIHVQPYSRYADAEINHYRYKLGKKYVKAQQKKAKKDFERQWQMQQLQQHSLPPAPQRAVVHQYQKKIVPSKNIPSQYYKKK